MGYRVKGASALGVGLSWEKTPGDAAVARRVLAFLEDRRVLFGDRHMEDGRYCVASALEIRQFLSEQLTSDQHLGQDLANALRVMRAACRQFVDLAGPDARNFEARGSGWPADRFWLALGELRASMGHQIGGLASAYKIDVEDGLRSLLPPEPRADDASWIPGFE